ncbi:hypothetical protein V8F20_000529 [Naviculisporaceae sp. PSN 640]
MYGGGYRGRGVPSQLTMVFYVSLTYSERHYSYECKVPVQERPYVARPSRTQQLSNPKLMPKLTTEVPEEFQKKKKGDEEVAKKKPEDSRKEGKSERKSAPSSSRRSPPPTRRRSSSYDSVSTVSTRSPSPPPRKEAPKSAPSGRARARDLNEPSHPAPDSYRRSVVSGDDEYYSQRSVSPERNRGRSYSRSLSRSISRSPEPRQQIGGRRDSYSDRRFERPASPVPRRREYSASRSRSRSPVRSPPRRGGGNEQYPPASRYRDREDDYPPPRRNLSPPPQRMPAPPPRERSLSPFSKRLALTQAMNRGGR